MTHNIIAIIPARGGSKGIPHKNVCLLAGKPLITYTIESAQKSKYISNVFVSTEDPEIMQVAKRSGAEIIERPTELAADNSPTIDTVIHALEYLETKKVTFDIVVLLQATSPLRNETDIDNAIDIFIRNKCDSVISVCENEHPPYWCYKIKNHYLNPIFDENHSQKRRQDLPVTYRPNGAIYIAKHYTIREKKDFMGSKSIPYVMNIEKSLDIDTEFDLLLAGLLIEKNIC